MELSGHAAQSEIAEIDGRDTERPTTRALWTYSAPDSVWLLGEPPAAWPRLAPYWPDHPVPWSGLSREGGAAAPQDMVLGE